MIFSLVGSTEEKIGSHLGLFTRSYQETRALYDAKIRNWEIEYKDNIFLVKNSENVLESVYVERNWGNCSCSHFIENECGTCMHIEAVRLIYNEIELPRIRPISYIDDNFKIKTTPNEAGEPFLTPSIEKFNLVNNSRKLPTSNIQVEDLDVFKEHGITLFDFQKESIKLMLKNMHTVLVLRMGLGKTLCALACAKILNLPKCIIVCPNSLKYQWQHEINRFNLGSSIIISKRSDIGDYSDQRFLILSYEMFNSNSILLGDEYDLVIVDEIQKIKNREGKTWQTMAKIHSNWVFALSGTPIQNNISDLISLIDFLNPFELKPEWRFYETFCDCTRARLFGIKAEKINALRQKLSRYIVNPVVDYSKFKLPVPQIERIVTTLSEEQRTVHDSNFEAVQVLIAKSMQYPLTFGEKLALNGMLTKARVAATDARLFNPDAEKSEKFQKIEQLIEKLVKQGKKVIIYSEWIKTLALLYSFLKEKNINYVEFNGSFSAKKRDSFLMKFIEDPNIKVFLSTDSGGIGIDKLQLICHNMIHVEKVWNPMKIEQRNGRLVRALQKNDTVNIYMFESDAAIESMMTDNHFRKYAIITDMLK